MKRTDRGAGFTVVELLVTAALVGILLSFTIRSMYEILIDSFHVKQTTVAASQNLFFLEQVARDARIQNRIAQISDRKAVFTDADGEDTITWRIENSQAWREHDGKNTPMPIRARSVVFAWKDAPPDCKYLCVAGEFIGLGMIEQGVSLRLDP